MARYVVLEKWPDELIIDYSDEDAKKITREILAEAISKITEHIEVWMKK